MKRRPVKRIEPNIPQQIPTEIITEILLRLPVKSLLQFRSVSKSWRSLISDPKFVKTHLKICSKNDENSHHRLMFWSSRLRRITIKQCHPSPVLNLASVNLIELDYPMKHPNMYKSVSIVGSINGLISIAIGKHDTFLWNPTTRISKKLPQSGFKLCPDGFGYDESTDDYKIVGFFRSGIESPEVMVYSLRADCWRRICDFPSGCIPNGKKGKFLKGAIHWVAYLKNRDNGSTLLPNTRSIVTLDLVNETYSELPQPNYRAGEFALSIVVQGECLFLLSGCRQCHRTVWMMKEYGVRESWTKLASFPYSDGSSKYEFPNLLYVSKEGEMLLAFGLRVLLFDLKSNSFRNLDNPNFGSPLGATTYIESLVSPLIQEGQEMHQ